MPWKTFFIKTIFFIVTPSLSKGSKEIFIRKREKKNHIFLSPEGVEGGG